jgi:hypothetical protein
MYGLPMLAGLARCCVGVVSVVASAPHPASGVVESKTRTLSTGRDAICMSGLACTFRAAEPSGSPATLQLGLAAMACRQLRTPRSITHPRWAILDPTGRPWLLAAISAQVGYVRQGAAITTTAVPQPRADWQHDWRALWATACTSRRHCEVDARARLAGRGVRWGSMTDSTGRWEIKRASRSVTDRAGRRYAESTASTTA